MNTPLLDVASTPEELRKLDVKQLRQYADEVRQEMIDSASVTGGHFGAGLGVVELTVALHYVFNTPDDRLIWDVGHQAYPHKIITGRRDRMRTIRQGGGLSPFTKRKESEYDPFGAGHSSTSISAAVGMAVANRMDQKNEKAIAVIGDGSMSAGLAYEAMNNAQAAGNNLIVILNDNDMSIAPPVGSMSAYLARLISSKPYLSFRDIGRKVMNKMPRYFMQQAKKAEEYARSGERGTLFEELGFYYVGPIDGHNMDHLIPVLENVRDAEDGPILVHVVTEKGHGHPFDAPADDKYHAVPKFDVKTGEQFKAKAKAPSYTSVFAKALIAEAEKNEKLVAITAAMPSGTGLDKFGEKFPERTFDVGIAEQHAVTFAAGLACEKYIPFVVIYSTFLQRAYDMIVHDVAIQNLPVRFALDRAGLVGADGPTHAGSFDVTYLASLPNFVVMAAADEVELMHMVATQVALDDRPSAVRYPRGEASGLLDLPEKGEVLELGKGRIVKKGSKVAILSLGTRLGESLKAADILDEKDVSVTVADARFAKPLDKQLIRDLAINHDAVITIEEGSIGGFGAHVMDFMSDEGILDGGLKVRSMKLPDEFIEHGNPFDMYDQAGLNAKDIVAEVLKVIGRNDLGDE